MFPNSFWGNGTSGSGSGSGGLTLEEVQTIIDARVTKTYVTNLGIPGEPSSIVPSGTRPTWAADAERAANAVNSDLFATLTQEQWASFINYRISVWPVYTLQGTNFIDNVDQLNSTILFQPNTPVDDAYLMYVPSILDDKERDRRYDIYIINVSSDRDGYLLIVPDLVHVISSISHYTEVGTQFWTLAPLTLTWFHYVQTLPDGVQEWCLSAMAPPSLAAYVTRTEVTPDPDRPGSVLSSTDALRLNGTAASEYLTRTQVNPSTTNAGYARIADRALNSAALDGFGAGDFLRPVNIAPEPTRPGYAKNAVQSDVALDFARGILEYRRASPSGVIAPGIAFGTTAYYNKMIAIYPDDVVAAPTVPHAMYLYDWPVGTEVWYFNTHDTRVVLIWDDGVDAQFMITCAVPPGPGKLGDPVARGWFLRPRGVAMLKQYFTGDDGNYSNAGKAMLTGDIVTAT